MLRRKADRGGFWQSVSGHLERDESADAAARREVREETGLEPKTVILLEKVNVFFKPSEEVVYLEPCFGVEVANDEPVLSHEHDAHHWVDLREALALVPFAGLREALAELEGRLVTRRDLPPDG
jgi:8-oxo-dGTP pyrophosphatase MutT (NUDIX family)